MGNPDPVGRQLRAARTPPVLNVLAVALALAAANGVVWHKVHRLTDGAYGPAFLTFLFGALWAAVYRVVRVAPARDQGARLGPAVIALAFSVLYTLLTVSELSDFWWRLTLPLVGYFAGVAALWWAHRRAPEDAIEQRVGLTAAVVAAVAGIVLFATPELTCALGNRIEEVGLVCTPHGKGGWWLAGNGAAEAMLAREEREALTVLYTLVTLGGASGLLASAIAWRHRRA